MVEESKSKKSIELFFVVLVVLKENIFVKRNEAIHRDICREKKKNKDCMGSWFKVVSNHQTSK